MKEDYYSYTKKWFGRLAPFYDMVELFVSGVRDKVVEFTDAREGSIILDVCTGTGEQAFAFARRGYDVVGIDLSEDMLEVASEKNKYGNVEFEVADATNMPFNDNRFDVSSVSFALHDMPSTIRVKVLKEMVRVSRPKGILIIVDYALPKNKIGRYLIRHLAKLYESKYYSEFLKTDLRSLLGKLGIEIEKELPIMLGAAKVLKCLKEAMSTTR